MLKQRQVRLLDWVIIEKSSSSEIPVSYDSGFAGAKVLVS